MVLYVVIELEAADAVEVPAAFVAVTVNVYAVPSDNPSTVITPLVFPSGFKVPVIPPGEDVAVYKVMLAPPLDAGAVHPTVALVGTVVLAVAVPIVGAPGTDVVLTITELEDDE